MLHLILDSSQPHTHWVLAENQQVLEEIKSQQRFDAAEQTLNLLESLLKKHALELNDIMNYAYISGPGSFTGLRIGAAILKALSFANHQQNIVNLDPCHLLAQQYIHNQRPTQDCFVVPIIASRKGHVYHCTYHHTQETLNLLEPVQEQAIAQIDMHSFTKSKADSSIVFVGPDSQLLSEEVFFVKHDSSSITAKTLVESSYQAILSKAFVDKASFGPNYIVQSVAKPKHNR